MGAGFRAEMILAGIQPNQNMKTTITLFAGIAWLSFSAVAGDSPSDGLTGHFFPPEAVMQAHERLGLTAAQKEALRATMERTQSRFEEMKQRVERETTALAELAKPERVDEKALLAQLNKVLEAEAEVKRLHLTTLAAIKNTLTPEQQSKLRALMKEHGAGGPVPSGATKERLQSKIKKVQAGVQKWQEAGRDPSEVARIMEEFKPLIDAGKIAEAEAVLERALKALEAEAK